MWSALLTQFQTDGTAGKALSMASSGGVDLNALAQAVLDKLNAAAIPVTLRTEDINSVADTSADKVWSKTLP